jgi:hypothetical protein
MEYPQGRATIVEYDLTSSEDELQPDQSYIYCSATKLPALCGESYEEDTSDASSQSSEDEHQPASKRPRLFDLTCHASPGPSEPESEPETKPAAVQVVTVASSSEEGEVQPVPAPSRKSYALRMQDLPGQLAQFLKEARSFFTRPHALERHGQQVAASTYGKAEERILCEYFTFTVMSSMKLFCRSHVLSQTDSR